MMSNKEAYENLKILVNRWQNDEDMYSDTMEIEIDEEFMQSIYTAKSALGAIEQYRWERDVAIHQLRELGLELGQKVDDVKKAIGFKKYFDELYGEGLEVANWHLNGDLEPFDTFYESALDCQ